MSDAEHVEQSETVEAPAPAAVPAVTRPSFATAFADLHSLNRVRRTRQQYERLRQPEGTEPGAPVPSIEGWVVFLSNLPPNTTVEHIGDIFATFNESDPDHFGPIRTVKLPLTQDCCSQGYALVELETEEGFRRAVAELPGAPVTFGDDGVPRTLSAAPAFLAEEEEPEEEEESEETELGQKRQRGDAAENEEPSGAEPTAAAEGETEAKRAKMESEEAVVVSAAGEEASS